MDGQTFLDDLRSDHETQLSRLGSSKAVYALTAGEMDGDAVKAGTAEEARAVADTVGEWAAADGDADAAALYEDVASFAADRAEQFGDPSAVDPGRTAVAAGLQGHEGDLARTGALAGGLLVLGKLAEQLVGFFVGDADRAAADTFREFRDDVADQRDAAAATLASLCEGDGDRELARAAADHAVEAAYDWYVETLEGMGVKPKNVC